MQSSRTGLTKALLKFSLGRGLKVYAAKTALKSITYGITCFFRCIKGKLREFCSLKKAKEL